MLGMGRGLQLRKLKFIFAAVLVFVCALSVGMGQALKADAASEKYYVGGMTAGFLLGAGGAEVIELSEVVAEDGAHSPAKEAGIRAGDCICAVDGVKISSIKDLNDALARSEGKEIKVIVKRNGESAEISLTPVKEKKSGKYKIGVLIRDTLSGIGTVTYIQKDTKKFGALGHKIADENSTLLQISDPKVYLCSIIGVNKGTRGKAGELRGLFLNDKPIAKAEKICETGLYGTFENYDFSDCELLEAAPLSEATIGKAYIYSTVNGIHPQKYEIAIAKVDEGNKENKNFVIKVTDEKLIEATGGIVQGMSGSPIIQNGKLIGAVTHVFINDPTRGYGIGIEKMLNSD